MDDTKRTKEDKPNNSVVSTTYSAKDTYELAARFATQLRAGDVITLNGDLGAGKTTFTQGLAHGLGVTTRVNSPTYTLIHEYEGERFELYHMDMYRVEDESEELGLEEYFNGNGITVIEWAEKIEMQLPVDRLDIYMKFGDVENSHEGTHPSTINLAEMRQFVFVPRGTFPQHLLAGVEQ